MTQLIGRGRIAVVDPDSKLHEAIHPWLAPLGHDIVAISDPAGLLCVTDVGGTALILISIEPDSIASLVILARLRELPQGNHIPIIGMTGATGAALERLEQMTSPLEIRRFIAKPLEEWAVLEAASAAIIAAADEEEAAGPGYPGEPPPKKISAPLGQSSAVASDEVKRIYLSLATCSHYELMGLPEDAGPDAIREAFQRMSKRYRPQFVHLPSSEDERYLRGIDERLHAAMRDLKTPESRARYRERLGRRRAVETANRTLAERGPPPPIQRPAPTAAPPPSKSPTAAPPPNSAPTAAPPAPPGGAPRRNRISQELRRPGASEGGAQVPPPPSPSPAARVANEAAAATQAPVVDGRDLRQAEGLAETAHAQAVLGDFEGAVELLRRAVYHAPDDTALKYALELNQGRMFRLQGSLRVAKQHLEIAVELAPTSNLLARDELRAVVTAIADAKSKRKQPAATERGGLRDLLGLKRKE